MLPVAAQSMEDAGDLSALRRQASDLRFGGRFAEAAVVSERSRALAERQLGPRDPELAETLSDLAYLYLKLGRQGDAEILSGRALAIYDGSSARPGGKLWDTMRILAEAYTRQGRAADAEAALGRARAIEQAVSVPFEMELAVPYEIITSDLKRLGTRDCGVVSFKVDDAQALLSAFDSFPQVQQLARLEIGHALRKVVGTRSAAQVRGEADRLARELEASLNTGAIGYSVRAMPEDVVSCLKQVN